MNRLKDVLLLSTALGAVAAVPALANPLGGDVVAGDAVVAGEGTPTVTVTQSTDKAIIDWRSFNVGLSDTTEFAQPSSRSVTLNRVTGGEGASTIEGQIKANGQVFLVNPDGILFGKDARIDVGGLLATTNDISNSDFMAGTYRFNVPGNPSASVVNLGTINIADTGIAALVAPGVRNAGTITANFGKVSLASGNQFTLDLYGDDLINLAVGDSTAGQVIDVATGKPLSNLVSNSGLIKADGGTVELTASAARSVVDSVINNTGNIEANSVGLKNGKIVLSAATSKSVPPGTPKQTVKVAGTLSASGRNPGEAGGTVQVTGEVIDLTVATIDAFGWNGGGKVLIGGDYRGGNVAPGVIEQYGTSLEPYSIPTATYVFADPDTRISADALQDGNGGKVILWSDLATVTAATITARGGAQSGNGGFVETSGEYLSALTPVDASAPNGIGGTWLLDPLDVYIENAPPQYINATFETIYAGASGWSDSPTGSGPSIIDAAEVETVLNSGTNVRVITRGTPTNGNGDVHVEASITKSAGGDVYAIIDSAHDVIFTRGIRLVSTHGKVSFRIYAEGTVIDLSATTLGLNGGSLRINGIDPYLMAILPSTSFIAAGSAQQAAALPAPANSTLPYGPVQPPAANLWAKQLDNHEAASALLSYALLANAIQNGDTGFDQAGWTPLQSWEDILRQNSKDPNIDIEKTIATLRESGFSAATYEKDGMTVLAFAGSNHLNDWTNANLPQFFQGKTNNNQYEFALALSLYMLKGVPSSKIRLVGYSLGGGLAQYVSSELHLEAITFNAAGLSDLTTPVFRSTGVVSVRASDDPISAHGNQLGDVAYEFVGANTLNPLERHSMDRLIEAIRGSL